MARAWMAAVILVLSAASARADLSLRNIQAAQGPLGPERKSVDYFPNDEVFYRYTVIGLQTDKEGEIDVLLESRITDAQGKSTPGSSDPLKGKLTLAGGTFAGTSAVRLANNYPPGEYTLTVTVTDKRAAEKVEFARKFQVKPIQFAIVMPRFFFGDSTEPAPAGGFVGQILRVRLRVIGFDKSQGKIDADMTVQILDADGKELMPQPKRGTLSSADPQEVAKAAHLNFTEVIGLNRPGTFTLRITVTDKIGKQSTSWETPLEVRVPF